MFRSYQNKFLIALFFVFSACANGTSKIQDGDVILKLKNGKPCFTYSSSAQDEVPRFFQYLSVTSSNETFWQIAAGRTYVPSSDRYEAPLGARLSPLQCIEYGETHAGAAVTVPPKPLKNNVPYLVHMETVGYQKSAGEAKLLLVEEKYRAYFCVTHDHGGRPVLKPGRFNTLARQPECIEGF